MAEVKPAEGRGSPAGPALRGLRHEEGGAGQTGESLPERFGDDRAPGRRVERTGVAAADRELAFAHESIEGVEKVAVATVAVAERQ